jgi:hypothetical protein
MAGYHIKEIPKGTYGTVGKILEEALELEDAQNQGVRIMALMELSDLYGAMQGYLEQEFPGISMEDLAKMSKVTERVFQSGGRQ